MAAKKSRKKVASTARTAKARPAKKRPGLHAGPKPKSPKPKSRKVASRKVASRKVVEPAWDMPLKSLTDVRWAIDRMDDILAPLLCKRNYFVRQAAQFKPSVAGVVILPRVEEIIVRVRKIAEEGGMNPDTMEIVYRAIIDSFTADEQRQWRANHRRG